MTVVNQPDVTFNIIPAQGVISNEAQKVLFVGQQLPAGSATSGALVTNINTTGGEDALFGEDSHLASMLRAARKLNKNTRFDAIPLDDNGGAVDATGTVTFTGTATEAGTITIALVSEKNFSIDVAIADTDTATTIGDTFEAAVTALSKIPVTASNTTGAVTLTAKNGGEIGNNYGIKVTGSVAGVTVATVAFASGATNPVLTNLFDVIGDERYQTIVWPNTYTLSTLTDLLDPRFNVDNDIQDGVGITTQTDTFANLQTNGNAQNSASLVIVGNAIVNEALYRGGEFVEQDDVVSSEIAAIRSLRLTEGASIARFVISKNGPRDSFGGPALASKPYFNTPLSDLIVSDPGRGFTKTEIESLNTAGVAIFGNNSARNAVILGEVVTTRKTDSAGNPETTFKFLNLVDTSVNIREFYFNNVKSRYAQSRLTEGDLIPNRDIANEASIRAFLEGLYVTLSNEDFVLTQAGETSRNFYKENLSVSIDIEDGKVTVNSQVLVVTQLRDFNGTIQIAFSTEA